MENKTLLQKLRENQISFYLCVEMRYQLEENYDYDFKLFGISCHTKDYRLCWSLNKSLEIKLEKSESEIELLSRKSASVSNHNIYDYYCEELQSQFYLLVNRTPQGFLVPEQQQADFLLMLKESYETNHEEMLEKIKQIPFVLTAFEINVESLKSKKNLIF